MTGLECELYVPPQNKFGLPNSESYALCCVLLILLLHKTQFYENLESISVIPEISESFIDSILSRVDISVHIKAELRESGK